MRYLRRQLAPWPGVGTVRARAACATAATRPARRCTPARRRTRAGSSRRPPSRAGRPSSRGRPRRASRGGSARGRRRPGSGTATSASGRSRGPGGSGSGTRAGEEREEAAGRCSSPSGRRTAAADDAAAGPARVSRRARSASSQPGPSESSTSGRRARRRAPSSSAHRRPTFAAAARAAGAVASARAQAELGRDRGELGDERGVGAAVVERRGPATSRAVVHSETRQRASDARAAPACAGEAGTTATERAGRDDGMPWSSAAAGGPSNDDGRPVKGRPPTIRPSVRVCDRLREPGVRVPTAPGPARGPGSLGALAD